MARRVHGYGESQLGPRILTIAPEGLRGRNGVRCPETVAIARCDPNADGLPDRDFRMAASFTTAGLPPGRVVAVGQVGRVEPSSVRAGNLRVRLDPLPLSYVELTVGKTPLAGILRGARR